MCENRNLFFFGEREALENEWQVRARKGKKKVFLVVTQKIWV